LTALQIIEDDFDIKKKVEDVLNDTGFTEQRAAKMSVDDLLKYVSIESNPSSALLIFLSPPRLLSAFHDVGIHFA
jgi:18S rRNA (adenine1779-N6/adenine1780-N6)-dimethyltransferase